jgi:ubiquitin C-terminal hydrolase
MASLNTSSITTIVDLEKKEKENVDETDIELPEKPEDNKLEKDEKKDEKDDKKEEDVPNNGITGLNNMGNTCYLNSVLQIVSHVDGFRNFLFKGEFTEHLKGELEDSLFYQTYRIIKHLWDTSEKHLSPKSFKKKFVEKQTQFMGFEQQDSHEAMHFLLDHLHEEIARPVNLNINLPPELNEYFDFCDKYYQMFELDKDAKIDKGVLKILDSKLEDTIDYFGMKYYHKLAKKYSVIADLFQSITSSVIKCPDCSHVSVNFDNTYMIEIEIPELKDEEIIDSEIYKKLYEQKKEELKEKKIADDLISKFCLNELKHKQIYKLSDLLMNFQKQEILDNDNLWNCEICEKKVNGIKQTKIFKNPEYLIIHFKRFKHVTINEETRIIKIKNLITYEKFLEIKPLMVKNTNGTKYELLGGINHMGEYQFGHFTNFAKNGDKWYNFNDDSVSDINCTGIPLTPNAYMLVYKRCV